MSDQERSAIESYYDNDYPWQSQSAYLHPDHEREREVGHGNAD